VPVYEDCANPGGLTCFDVSPTVADHKASREIDPLVAGGSKKQSRFRFSAVTFVPIVITDIGRVDRKRRRDRAVDRLYLRLSLRAARHIRLVRHHHEGEAGRAEGVQRITRVGIYF